MVLSETQGPIAFLGYPRGHRVPMETPCHKGTLGLTTKLILSLEPVRLTLPETATSLDFCPDSGNGLRRSSLFGSALVQRQTLLLSSTRSRRWRRSCAPALAVPSPAAGLWPPIPDKTHT